jgi:hypothetical protein
VSKRPLVVPLVTPTNNEKFFCGFQIYSGSGPLPPHVFVTKFMKNLQLEKFASKKPLKKRLAPKEACKPLESSSKHGCFIFSPFFGDHFGKLGSGSGTTLDANPIRIRKKGSM